MCTIAVSGLAHLIEAAGLSTTAVGLIPQHLQAMRPPRALAVPFELGRPMGPPDDADVQRATLGAALSLLDNNGPGPVLEFLPVDHVPGDSAGTWVCPVSFPQAREANLSDRLRTELSLLLPWWERGRKQRGFTATGTSGLTIDAICDWLVEFLEDPMPIVCPDESLSLADCFKLGVEELKTFYLEAATARPGQATASELNDWFWDETSAGELIWQLRTAASEHPDEGVGLHAGFTLVPAAQVQRRDPAK